MSDERSPGVGPLTWVTLGLLLSSWVVNLTALGRAFFFFNWRGSAMWVALWALVLFAHGLWCFIAWRGRAAWPVRLGAFLLAVASGFFAVQNTVLLLGPYLSQEVMSALHAVGLNHVVVSESAFPTWCVAGVVGVPIALMVWWTTRRKPFVA